MRRVRKQWLFAFVVGTAAIVFGGSAGATTTANRVPATICPSGYIVVGSLCPVYPATPTTPTPPPPCSKTPATKPAYFVLKVDAVVQLGLSEWSVSAYNSDNTRAINYDGCAQWGLSVASSYAPLAFRDGIANLRFEGNRPFSTPVYLTVKIPNGPTLTSRPLKLIGPPDHYVMNRIPGTVTAPAKSDLIVTVTAYDAAGNVAVLYSTIPGGQFWSDSQHVLRTYRPAAFKNGVSTTTAQLDLSKAQAQAQARGRPVGDQIHFGIRYPQEKVVDSNVFIIASNR